MIDEPRRPASGTQHILRSGNYTAVIASVGASLRCLTIEEEGGPRDLVVPFEADEVRPAYRGTTLVPWPNRVVDGRYRFDGVDYELALTEPSRGHALHGLGAWLDYDAIDKGADHVTLQAEIEPQSAYPWRLSIETTFRLGPDGLTQTVRATNLASSRAPYGTGPHPYLVAGAGKVDDWILELPADEVLTVTEDRLIPVALEPVDASDPRRFDYRTPRPIADARIDHAYTGLHTSDDGSVTVTVTDAAGSGAGIVWDGACSWVQIHTADRPGEPADRTGLAVEPMTCPPDAFNSEKALIVLDPGASAEAEWTIFAIARKAA
ncbi:aldose 1-epimerase family protein [Microbacterium limosum]|uniref:Aldose 1-epimerase family protein n=1 Tax=Microbacterium limosum TaxID=3079935 RepID=A0AAU0MJM2_9MICO|nr:aldose 1-epimerase family protein [Microbacterium sp. Y20]WOQ70159.1 aldose 1-epimerase family protein [Microbacterium sp. Y20]